MLKPVYLTTYNMTHDSDFIDFAMEQINNQACEIGMHLHPWCSPPVYSLGGETQNRSYLIEYPLNIMQEKIKRITASLEDTFRIKIVSHRAGRWAINQDYIELLSRFGYHCDCSVTPGVDWRSHLGANNTTGSNYRSSPTNPYLISNDILEVPVTIRHLRFFDSQSIHSLKELLREGYHLIKGKQTWLRPSNSTLHQMKKIGSNN
jgi:hypothetical protein